MHFAKTYADVLQTLPEDLQRNAIQYRQLKKLIKSIVNELESLGLGPDVLESIQKKTARLNDEARIEEVEGGEDDRSVHTTTSAASTSESTTSTKDVHLGSDTPPSTDGIGNGHAKPVRVVYEVVGEGDHIEPRLRLWVDESGRGSPVVVSEGHPVTLPQPTESSLSSGVETPSPGIQDPSPPTRRPRSSSLQLGGGNNPYPALHEIVIPLTSDTAFFRVLATALQALTAHLAIVESNFTAALASLSATISRTAHPISNSPPSTSAFRSRRLASALKGNDLYAWREIFALYVEMQIFQSGAEVDRGERSVEEAERRLRLFAEKVAERGLSDLGRLRTGEGRHALEMFLELNFVILNLKKFQHANAEAIRKILKKHSKRTALPLPVVLIPDHPSQTTSLALPSSSSSSSPSSSSALTSITIPHSPYTDLLALLPSSPTSLPRKLLQSLGETLLPIIPPLDDYSCLICSDLAFRPIRLDCGHLFCVRCLVKMQKRREGACPCCRAPVVLKANRANIDLALQNFMQDWFPLEAQEKMNSNVKEARQEEVEELQRSFGQEQGDRCVIS